MRRANIVIVATLVVTVIVVIVVVEALAGFGGVAAVIFGVLGTGYWYWGPGVEAKEPGNREAFRDLSKRHPQTTYYYDDGSSSDNSTEGSEASRNIDR